MRFQLSGSMNKEEFLLFLFPDLEKPDVKYVWKWSEMSPRLEKDEKTQVLHLFEMVDIENRGYITKDQLHT